MIKFFHKIKTWFTAQEWVVLIASVLLSGLIISSLFWPGSGGSSAADNTYVSYGYTIAVTTAPDDQQIVHTVAPFDTSYQVFYEKARPAGEKAQVEAILEENVPYLHKLFDRHYDYYADDADPDAGLIHNVKTINESYGTGEPVEIDYPLYDILQIGLQGSIDSGSTFNMFIGSLSTYWDDRITLGDDYRSDYLNLDPNWSASAKATLDRLEEVLPKTEAEMTSTLVLSASDGHYFAQFNAFKDAVAGEISLTLGGLAKGYANDYIKALLLARGLTHGAIYGGGSSINTLGDNLDSEGWYIPLESPTYQAEYALAIERQGVFGMSTSGGYMGVYIPFDSDGDGIADTTVLRHHVIDPHTGYPAYPYLEVNVVSGDCSGAELEILSKAFYCQDIASGMAYRQHLISLGKEVEVAWVTSVGPTTDDSADTGYVYVQYTPGYEDFLIRFSEPHYQKVTN